MGVVHTNSWPAPGCEYITEPARIVTCYDEDGRPVDVDFRAQRCKAPAETLDIVNGYRCPTHPPRWEQAYAAYWHSTGWHDTAAAYRRTMIALLKERIEQRDDQLDTEEAA